jgi:protein TonB
VRQLISRHAEELERERKATREKEAEIQRLTDLIARLSVTDTTPGGQTGQPAPPERTVTGSGVDSPPRILTRSEPEYPVNARRLRVEGTVLLNVLVGTDGRVRDVKVLEADGGKLLSPAAVDAVRKWTFTPAMRSGRPVECWHKVPIRFAL